MISVEVEHCTCGRERFHVKLNENERVWYCPACYPGDKVKPSLHDILIAVLKIRPRTRNELVDAVMRPRTTIYDELERMISMGIAKREKVPRDTRGRPNIVFRLRRS